MTVERKLLGVNPSGGAGSKANVADVFSTYLYDGTGAAQTISNGINLVDEGGMVWIKARNNTFGHAIADSTSGFQDWIHSDTALAAQTSTVGDITGVDFDGFTLGADDQSNVNTSAVATSFASWTFRKSPKFFDVVTWTGDGTAGRTIAHGLNGPVGMMIVKCTSDTHNWPVWHKSVPTCTTYLNTLQNSFCGTGNGAFGDAAGTNINPTDSVFTVGSDGEVNGSSKTYVAYLWADNSAESADDQIIKCGSYTGNGSADGPEINLGWEPQWLMIKSTSSNYNWIIVDVMRGFSAGPSANTLFANTAASEDPAGTRVKPTSTGFKIITDSFDYNKSGDGFIYMAIRAPMMVEPETSFDVFAIEDITYNTDQAYSYFPVDFALVSAGTHYTTTRLLGTNVMTTNSTDDQFDWGGGNPSLDLMDGLSMSDDMNGYLLHMWKRAKGFFDVVTYTGNGNHSTGISHSLGAEPKMMWIKSRTESAGSSWWVHHYSLNVDEGLKITSDTAIGQTSPVFIANSEIDTKFALFGSGWYINNVGEDYVAYLFGSLNGVSKVGDYIGNGSSQTIECGFDAGSCFILIKRVDAAGDWFMWDSTRGIVAGNDPYLTLNSQGPEVTTDDSVDPVYSGFIVNQVSATDINVSAARYIFYAIA